MNPFDLALAAQRVGQPVETVADDAVNALDARRDENVGKLISYPLRHHSCSFSRAQRCAGPVASDHCSNVFQVQYSGSIGAYATAQRSVVD
jgi:RNA:NAD 2'-phosphotransferase (TPT1/KptA family)